MPRMLSLMLLRQVSHSVEMIVGRDQHCIKLPNINILLICQLSQTDIRQRYQLSEMNAPIQDANTQDKHYIKISVAKYQKYTKISVAIEQHSYKMPVPKINSVPKYQLSDIKV